MITVENCDQGAARPCDAAFYRANRAIAYLGSFLVGKTAGADQNEGFTLFVRERPERPCNVGKFGRPTLVVAMSRQ